MFGEITLIVEKRDKAILELLDQVPASSKPVLLPPISPDHKSDTNMYNVWELAIKNSPGLSFLKQFRDLQVFAPDIFKPAKVVSDLNIDLLRFVKHCAMSAGSKLKVVYNLERGDFLYEEIVWTFNYLNSNLEITEQLYVHDYNIEEFGQITKFRNGQVIFEEMKSIS